MRLQLTGTVAVILLFMIVILAIPFDSPVRAAGATRWQFTNTNYTDPAANDGGKAHTNDKKMTIGTIPEGPAQSVQVPSDKAAWWYMDQKASTSVSFGAASWVAEAHMSVPTGSESKTITIKAWDVASNGDAVLLAQGSATPTVTTTDTHYQITLTPVVESQTIPTGHTIACSVETTGTNDLIIQFGQPMGQIDSWCESPNTDPGYPNPELSTIILMSLGMASIIGFLYFRHRTVKATLVG